MDFLNHAVGCFVIPDHAEEEERDCTPEEYQRRFSKPEPAMQPRGRGSARMASRNAAANPPAPSMPPEAGGSCFEPCGCAPFLGGCYRDDADTGVRARAAARGSPPLSRARGLRAAAASQPPLMPSLRKRAQAYDDFVFGRKIEVIDAAGEAPRASRASSSDAPVDLTFEPTASAGGEPAVVDLTFAR